MIHLGKIEEGSVKMISKYKSLLYHWYGLKGGGAQSNLMKNLLTVLPILKEIDWSWLSVREETKKKNENYRVLSIFSKNSNTVSDSLIWRMTNFRLWKDQRSTRLF